MKSTPPRLHRRAFPSLIAILALLFTTLAIPITQNGARAQRSTQIRFAFWGDPAEQTAYQAVADAFMDLHPDIDVAVDYTPGQGDYYRKIASDFAAGAPPDVYLTNYRQFGQYASAGALAPIQIYLDKSATIAESDFYDIALDAFRFGESNDLYCLPQNISSLVVYYNEALFENAGVPLPTSGWSWDTFIAAAQALTRDLDGNGTIDQYGVVVSPSMYRMVSFIWSAGGDIVDDLEHPTQLTIDTPLALAGLEKFVSLGVDGFAVVPPEEEVAAESDQDRFMRGGAAMYIQSRRPVPTLRQIEGFTWNVVSLPIIDQAATVLHSDAWCMAAASEHPEATWSFIEFAGSAPAQLLMAETGRTVPSMIEVSRSPVFLEGISLGECGDRCGDAATTAPSSSATTARPPANAQVYLDNIEIMRRLPSISTWIEIEDIFDAEFGRSLYIENFDVAAAAQTAIDRSQDAFDRATG